MQTVDIKRILREKKPGMARWVPGFLIDWLERVVRLEKINYVLANHGTEPPMQFIRSTLDYIGVSYTMHGLENIPADGQVIFAANHPLGGLDGLMLAEGVAPYVPSVKLIVNDLLMNLAPLAPIFAPVNKHGAQSADYARQIIGMYKSDAAVITFPAGLCSRLVHGKVTDPPWKRNFISKASDSGRRIIPVYIDGANSKFFYRFARLRKWLRVKLNLEMLFLPKEMFDQKGKHLDIYIGEPVTLSREHSHREWAEIIRRKAYALKPGKI